MTRSSSATLAIAASALVFGCHPGADTPGVPLYPNAATTRLPRDQVAQVAGPIAKIDDQDVTGQGGLFDLLPGCHIVELERRVVTDSYALSGGVYFGGQFPMTLYALRMKPGARYIIRREIYTEGSMSGRVALSAREELATGAASDLEPAKTADEIAACQDWARAARF